MMKISSLGEFGLIDRIRRTAARDAKRVSIGIGDDAAALVLSSSSTLLATTDMLLEGVHFDLATTDLFSLGWKSAAVNLSDIAAMGGTPRFCLTALGIPSSLTVRDLEEFYRGLNACLKKFGAVLTGGDTCRSRTGLVISVSVLGEADKKRIITRSGARPGDLLFVTGTLGDSAAGLELLQRKAAAKGSVNRKLTEKHLRPVPRVTEGRKLAVAGIASSMIDVSDGLSSDLRHICEQSGVGAEVFIERIPLSKELRSVKGLKQPPVQYALSGGEDYELLFTAHPANTRKLDSLKIAATEIGIITGGGSVLLKDDRGRDRMLAATGYDHFRNSRRRGAVR